MNSKRHLVSWIVVFVWALFSGGMILWIISPLGLRFIPGLDPNLILPAQEVHVGPLTQHLSDGLNFQKLEFANLSGLPQGSLLRIQQLSIRLKSTKLIDLEIDCDNIRLILPHSDPIVFTAQYRDNRWTGNIYSRSISVEEILGILPRRLESNPKGVIRDIDLYFEGPVSQLAVTGKFFIGNLVMPRFTLSEAPGSLELVFQKNEEGYAPKGKLDVREGRVKTKNALLKLSESKLYFSGSFNVPSYDVRGASSVGRVTMDIVLLGTPKAPLWQFYSSPPMPEEMLMLMFLTGKSFGTVPDTDFDRQKLTPDMAKDLADYLLLGGEGGRIAEQLGIKELSLIYDRNTAGIGVKKELTDYLDVGYSIQEKGFDPATSDLKHTIEAEWKLNPHFSLEVDKELYQTRNQEELINPLRPDDRFIFKYKSQF